MLFSFMPLLDHLWLLLHLVVLLDQDAPKILTMALLESHSLIFEPSYRMHRLHLNTFLKYLQEALWRQSHLSFHQHPFVPKENNFYSSMNKNKYPNPHNNIKTTSVQVILFNLQCGQGRRALLFLPGLQKDPWFVLIQIS